MGRAVITGDRQLERALTRLADKSADRVASAAIRGGLGEIRKAQRKAAPVGETKALKESIGSRFEKKRGRSPKVTAKAGINVGKRKAGRTVAPHAHLVGLGTGERFLKSGKSVGRMPANNFISVATLASQSKQKAAMSRRAARALEREAQKARKR